MKKTLLFLMLVICLSTSIYSINLEPVTVEDGDLVFINHSKGYVGQYPKTLRKGTEATLSFQNKMSYEKYYICFDFPVHHSYIKVDMIEKKQFFGLLDKDLKQEHRENNRICFKEFKGGSNTEIRYKIQYIDKGSIKYNVTISPHKHDKDYSKAKNDNELIVLDPYMIGNLAEDEQLVFYAKFDGDLSYTTTNQSFNNTNETEKIITADTYQMVREYSDLNERLDRHYIQWYYVQGGAWDIATMCMKTEWLYLNGSVENSSAQCSPNQAPYQWKLFTNPHTKWTVEDVKVWLKSDVNNNDQYIKNGYVDRYIFINDSELRYYINGTAGYDFVYTNSTEDVFGVQDGVNNGASFQSYGALFNATGNINLTNGKIFGDAFTIVQNVRFNATKSGENIFTIRNTTTNHSNRVELFVTSTFKLGMLVYDNGWHENGDRKYYLGSTTLQNNTFYSIIVTWDGTNLRGYIDGVEDTPYTKSEDDALTMVDVIRQRTIGGFDAGSYFNGTIEYTYIYDYAFDDEQINAIINDGTYRNDSLNETNKSIQFAWDDYVKAPALETLSADLPYTISFFMKSNGIYDPSITYDGVMGINNDRNILLDGTNNRLGTNMGQGGLDFTDTNSILTGTWYHYVYTYDGANGTIYINGGVAKETADYGAGSWVESFTIGKASTTPDYFFNGSVDEVMFFNYVLSQEDILVLYSGFNATGVDDCSVYNDTFLDLEIYNENEYLDKLISEVEIDISYYEESLPSYIKNYSAKVTGSSNYSFCFSTINDTIYYDAYIKYTTADGFTHRYYNYNQSFNGSDEIEVFVGNYNDTTGISDLTLTLRDTDTYQYVENMVGKLQRYYPAEHTWRTVQMDRSGDYGLLFFNIREEDTDYRLIFQNTTNYIFDTTGSMKFACDSGICDLTYVLDMDTAIETPDTLLVGYNYSNETKIINVSWIDPDGNTNSVRMLVTREAGNGTYQICNTTTVGASGSMVCDVSTETGLIYLKVYSTASPETPQLSTYIDIGPVQLRNLISQSEGVFWSVGIMVTMVGFGVISPVISLITGIIGLVVLYYLGLLSFLTMSFIIIAMVLAVIIALKVRQ